MQVARVLTLFVTALLIFTATSGPPLCTQDAEPHPSDITPSTSISLELECSSVIVTGTAAKNGRAILLKNRDWPMDRAHRPIYYPATPTTFAIVAVNEFTMGINEKGLAVMNTAMPSLEPDPAYGNLPLNQKILETCESVEEVARRLNDSRDTIGPTYRSSLGTIATCVGVVDRFGEGAFFEISNTEAYAEFVVDGYSTRANTPLIYGGISSPPGGRARYLMDALDDVYNEKGVVSWLDVMQRVSRYVRNKELGTRDFSIDGEACNMGTVASMVAVSGDDRYDGKLNCMWAACGPNPLAGVFMPSMVHIGEPPDVLSSLWSETLDKWMSSYASGPGEPVLLDPYRIREIQEVAFLAENYTCLEYDHLVSSIQEGLNEVQLDIVLSEYIERVVPYAAEVYTDEDTSVEIPPRVEHTFTDPPTTSQTTFTDTLTVTDSNTTGSFAGTYLALAYLEIGLGLAVGIVAVVLFARWKKLL